MTPPTPSSALAGGRSEAGFQACQVTVGLPRRARSGSRLNPTVSSPRASSASQTAEPRKPLAPVMSTRTGYLLRSSGRLLERPERPRLLGDPRDAPATRLP